MGHVVIACYRPKEGKSAELEALVATHVERLRAEGLVTDRAPIAARAADGTIVEVFEWRSPEAAEQAHSNPAVLAMWEEFGAVCDYVPVGEVAEAAQLFSGFTALS